MTLEEIEGVFMVGMCHSPSADAVVAWWSNESGEPVWAYDALRKAVAQAPDPPTPPTERERALVFEAWRQWGPGWSDVLWHWSKKTGWTRHERRKTDPNRQEKR